ncbi:MAG TPA: Wzz/FepE/Etk N-terminal domain-containing protein [Pseudomonas sp.]|nr:Wzz/FepE/Etk N-terminal domain-containing protein [Pseudomonas sp.]
MESHTSVAPATSSFGDEIDLFELCKSLWDQRYLIGLVSFLIFSLSVVYAYFTKPVYESRAYVLPPQVSDISGYNVGRSDAGLPLFTVDQVYKLFLRNLSSEKLRRNFFGLVYLNEVVRSGPDEILWQRLNKQLSIKSPQKLLPELWEVRMEYGNPEKVALWVNMLVAHASVMTAQEIQKNIASENHTHIKSLEQRIDALRDMARQRRADRIKMLEEALKIAKGAGLDSPSVTTWQNFSSNGNAPIKDGTPLYMHGSKALQAELEIMHARASDDPFIPELREIQERVEFLKGIDIDPQGTAVMTLDSSALVPERPIKPKKALIMAIGLILGGMAGVFIALVRCALKNRC